MVVPFGLTNAPGVFMCLMSGVFYEYLDKFIIIFLDDILVYSKSEEEHEHHLSLVLQVLQEHQLYAKISKHSFYKKQIHYLGHYFRGWDICRSIKYQSIKEWPTPKKIMKIMYFIGLYGHY